MKLAGNVPLPARTQSDLGEASASTLLTHMRLVLSRSAEQQAALDAYLIELQSKSSPNYHKWLTPEQFGELYGPADSDISAMVAWLESHGLKIESVAKGRTNIAFSGTVNQVEEAFHTQIHSFTGRNQQFYSNITDPSIPAALAPVVKGVAHLDTIVPKPDYVRGPEGMLDPEKKRLVPMASGQNGAPRPDLTIQEPPGPVLFIVPGDAATIYDTPNTTFNANYSSGTSYDGSGVKIGVGGAAAIQASTVVDFRTAFLGNSTAPTITNEDNVGTNGATDEAYIDTELSGGIAPGAAIYFYTSSDLTTAIDDAINANTVDIFSLSFSNCELALTSAENAEFEGYWSQAASQGIAVTVSTGDVGSALCDDSDANGTTQAQFGLSVNGFASTPYNIAVGGTDFAVLNNSFSTYVNTSQGTSSTFFRSALGPIPETTWNDSTQTDALLSQNVPWSSTSGNASIAAGSGGASSCSTNTSTDFATGSCTSGYAKPYWQRGTGVPDDKVRDLPDLSLMSGNGLDSAVWLACTDDTGQNSSGITVSLDCATQSDGFFYFNAFGGTSTAAPTFAGILALVQQKTGGRLGQAAKEIYDLYNGSHAGAIFHDTTVGNISVPCVIGSQNCAENTAGNYYESGYNTTAGYDLATGLGSVDVAQLLTYWGTGTGPETSTLSVTPSETSFAPTVSITVAATVSGNSTAGTPTGTVTLSGGGYTSTAEALSSSGAYTFTIPGGSLSVGSDVLTVTYSGDSNYASTSKTATVSVAAAEAQLSATTLTFVGITIGTATATQSVTLSNPGTSSLTISGITVGGTNSSDFSQSNTCGTSVAVGGTCEISVFFTPAAFGTVTASVSIADNATGSPQTISLSGSETEAGSYSLTAAAVTVAPGASGSSAITATGTSGYVGPNTITLSTCTLATSPAGATDSPTCAITGATITFAAGSTSGTGGSVSIGTTAASSNAIKMTHPNVRNSATVWMGAGGAALAGLLLLGIPARGRKWRTLLGVFFFAAALSLVSGCGGSGGGGGGGTSNPGTTAGSYTFTVSGTDSGGTKETVTVTVTVS